MSAEIPFDEAMTADLIVDAIYKGGNTKNLASEVVSKILSVDNAGGFRYKGSVIRNETIRVALTTSGKEFEWPDNLDMELGIFTYYGDNRNPGKEIHNTKKKGNLLLKKCFHWLHTDERGNIPPFFIFQTGNKGHDVIFRGLCVPGSESLEQTEDLVAIWKTKDGNRFQNYRSKFTVLDIPKIKREWIDDLIAGVKDIESEHCPPEYKDWVENGTYKPLRSTPTIEWRTKEQQLPTKKVEKQILLAIHNHFPKERATIFESCAAKIFEMVSPLNIQDIDVTRPSVDGGRDAVGKFRIGVEENNLYWDFALEAKCYKIDNGCGVKETNRLISRLRHRQFGIFITTSYVSRQAYQEIVEDKHPVLILSGIDIVRVLKKKDISDVKKVKTWLNNNWPMD